tara:strand:+ start:1077 stop:2165 length:1089 start_codon:yes stop_codon:yes gene_type:complete
MAVGITAAVITVGGSLLRDKIQSNRGANEQAAMIGSGTAPGIQPGPELNFTPVEGSEAKEFGQFEYDDPAQLRTNNDQTDILALLAQVGVNPEDLANYGIAGMSIGGALNAANGGELNLKELLGDIGVERGILNLASESLDELKESLYAEEPKTAGLVDLIPDVETKTKDVAIFDSTADKPVLDIDKDSMKEMGLASLETTLNPTFFERIQSMAEPVITYAQDNPEMFNALLSAGRDVLGALLEKPKKRKGSVVKTQTLPEGGLGAKRDYLRNIQPIMGTAFAGSRGFKDGGVLDRPMFTPMLEGGDIEGPGGPKDDLIPVMASDGEFMLSNAAVKHMGKGNHQKGIAMLEAFNKQGNRKYG